MKYNQLITILTKTAFEAIKFSAFWKPALGVLLGGLAGYLYYRLIGCSSGSCPITSNPYMSILFGVVMGLLITT